MEAAQALSSSLANGNAPAGSVDGNILAQRQKGVCLMSAYGK